MINEQDGTLDRKTKYGFGFGHIFNDMASAIWFTYTLLFYKMFFPSKAYWFVVTGQVFDSVVTVFIGLFFDGNFTKSGLFRLGKYKTWYYIGLVLLIFAFPVCFSEIPIIVNSQGTAIAIFLVAICFAQIGWSFCQIAHLSMINELSITSADRIWMASSRQAASIYSAIIVFAVFWYTLQVSDGSNLSTNDIYVISNDTFYITVFGVFHSLVFLFAIQENKLVSKKEHLQMLEANNRDENNLNCSQKRPMDSYSPLDWFSDATFYKIVFLYSFSRLYMNIPTYLVLYLPETLMMPKSSIAAIPLLLYVSGFLSSFVSNVIEGKFSNKYDLLLGIIFGIAASLWTLLGTCDNESFKSWQIYVVAILLGIAISMVKISTISMVADMIGKNSKCTSFVYGTVGCFEKILGGVTIGMVENFGPSSAVLRTTSAAPALQNATTSTIATSTSPTAFWMVCPNGHRSNLYYYYILTYGTLFNLTIILFGLFLLAKVQLK